MDISSSGYMTTDNNCNHIGNRRQRRKKRSERQRHIPTQDHRDRFMVQVRELRQKLLREDEKERREILTRRKRRPGCAEQGQLTKRVFHSSILDRLRPKAPKLPKESLLLKPR